MDTFGVSFSPTGQEDRTRGGASGAPGQEGGSVNPIQDAIRTLSYRLPRQTGGQGLAPSALLAGPGSAGIGGSPMTAGPMGGANPVQTGLEQLLRMLFGGGMGPMAAPMGMSAMGSGSAPLPNITPGASGAQAPEAPHSAPETSGITPGGGSRTVEAPGVSAMPGGPFQRF